MLSEFERLCAEVCQAEARQRADLEAQEPARKPRYPDRVIIAGPKPEVRPTGGSGAVRNGSITYRRYERWRLKLKGYTL